MLPLDEPLLKLLDDLGILRIELESIAIVEVSRLARVCLEIVEFV